MEAVAYLQLAAEFDQRAYAYMECMALLEEAWRLLSTLPESVDRDQRELKILSRLSPTHLILGVMNDESKEALSRLKDLALKVNDADSLFEGCASDFARCHYLGEHEQGRLSLDRMEMYLSPSGKPGQWGEFQLFRGLNTLSLGQPKRAVQHLEECEALCSGHKDLSFPSVNMTQPLSVVLALKALVLGPLGFPGRAEECIKNAYAVQNPQSDSSEDLWVMSYEFLLRWILRDVEACCRVNDPFESVVDTLGILGWSSLGRFSRGWCASEVGDAEAAVTIMQSAITDLDRGGWLVWRPFLHALLAEPLCRIGKVEEALRLMNWALERIEATGERVQESEVNRVRGEVLLSLPRPDAFGAEAAFRRAIAVAQKQETKLYELRATTSLARRLRTQGREREAKKSLSRCYRWFTEGFEYRDLKEARALLEELG
jgi:tetratricopeptide (TPR) repeat protein